MLTRVAAALTALLFAVPALAQTQVPQTLPANTVWGRTGIGSGPGQAIPIGQFIGLMGGVPNGNLATMPANTVKCNPTGSTAAAQDCTNPSVIGLTTQSVAVNPIASTSNQGVLITQSGSGSQSGGNNVIGTNDFGLNLLNITSDNIARPSGGSNKLAGQLIVHQYGGSAMIGGRDTLDVISILTAPSSASNNDHNYQAINAVAQANSGDGGTNTGAGAQGAVFAYGGAAILGNSAATNFLNLSFMEANVAAITGTSLQYKSLIQLASLPQDAVNGATFDCMVCWSGQTGAVGWKNGMLFGNMNGQQPLASTGCILCTVGSSTITTGIDLSSYTITGNAFHTTGFAVSNNGDTTVNHFLAAGTTPTAGTCAGFSLATNSSDTAGRVNFTSATSCSINFQRSFANAPFCTVSPSTAASTVQVTTTTTGMSVTFGAAQTQFDYMCPGA